VHSGQAVQKNLDDLKTALEAKDNELANKDGELQTFIIIVCVIAGAAFCGCAALAMVFFIDRRRKS
jgi:hypothetical protein